MSTDEQTASTERTVVTLGPETDSVGLAFLIVIHGDQLGLRISVTDTPLIVGRSIEAGLQIEQSSVSREHCKIWSDGSRVLVTDLGATNKTLVNDMPVDETPLSDGDHITVGKTILKFVDHDSVEAKYHEELYQLATVDSLTELRNRRYFEEQLDREIVRCRRHQRSLCLLYLDIDYFKQVNDSHGHNVGDKVLKQLARTLQEQTRGDDLVARIGGEEFAILLSESTLERGIEAAESIRARVAAKKIMVENQIIRITISVGVAQWVPEMEKASQLTNLADQYLYKAKTEGRNRVVAATITT